MFNKNQQRACKQGAPESSGICQEYKKKDVYPKRLVGDEGKVGGGRLLAHPFPRDAGAAQKLAVREAGSEFQGHVIRRLLLL